MRPGGRKRAAKRKKKPGPVPGETGFAAKDNVPFLCAIDEALRTDPRTWSPTTAIHNLIAQPQWSRYRGFNARHLRRLYARWIKDGRLGATVSDPVQPDRSKAAEEGPGLKSIVETPVVEPEARPQAETALPAAEGIPFMVTRAMKERLRGLGYTDEQIADMRPAEAHDILTRRAASSAAVDIDALVARHLPEADDASTPPVSPLTIRSLGHLVKGEDDSTHLVRLPPGYSSASLPPDLQAEELRTHKTREEESLAEWESSPYRPLCIQAAGEIKGPERCRDWISGVARGEWWYYEHRIKEWLQDFISGQRHAYYCSDGREVRASEFGGALTRTAISELLMRKDIYVLDQAVGPVAGDQ